MPIFDPYHKWLGIPPEEQPPDHYRLFGLKLFEHDLDVIATAADRQMTFLKSCTSGEHVQAAQRLLNELAAARLCLLNADRRQEYDASLRLQLDGGRQTALSPSPRAGVRSVAIAGGAAIVLLSVVLWAVSRRPPEKANQVDQSSPTEFDGNDQHDAPQELLAGVQPPDSEQSSAGSPAADEPRPDSNKPGASRVAQVAPADGDGAAKSADAPPRKSDEVSPPPAASATTTSDDPAPAQTTPNPAPALPVTAAPERKTQQQPETQSKPEISRLPDADSLKTARQAVNGIFEDELNQAKSAAQKSALAERLLLRAADPGVAPAEQYAILELALPLAVSAINVTLVENVLTRFADEFEPLPLPQRAAFLLRMIPARVPAEHRGAALDLTLKIQREAVDGNDFPVAEQLQKYALDTARATKDAAALKRVQAVGKLLRAQVAEFEKIEPQLKAVAQDGADGTAYLAVGRWHCFYKDQWPMGLPLLAKGSDPQLAILAAREMETTGQQGAAAAEAQAGLGDAWWEIAQKADELVKPAIERHARGWYQQALPALTGLKKASVEKRVGEVGAPPAGTAGELPAGELWVLQGRIGRSPHGVFSADSRKVVYMAGKIIKVVDISTRQELLQLEGHTANVLVARFSGNGKRIVSVGADESLRVWDAVSGREEHNWKAATAPPGDSASVSRDGRRVVFSSGQKFVSVWDLDRGKELQRFQIDSGETSVCGISGDGKLVVSCGIETAVRIWDVSTGKVLHQFGMTHHGYGGGLAADGTLAITCGGIPGGFAWELWDMRTGKQLRGASGPGTHAYGATLALDKRRMLLGGADGKPLHTFTGHTRAVRGIAFSPDGRMGLSDSDDGTLRLWGLPKQAPAAK